MAKPKYEDVICRGHFTCNKKTITYHEHFGRDIETTEEPMMGSIRDATEPEAKQVRRMNAFQYIINNTNDAPF
jgi:methyl coenzyme M reductase subunit D